jgi:hypothetical protein
MNDQHDIRSAVGAPPRDESRPAGTEETDHAQPELTEPLLSASLPAVPFIPTATLPSPGAGRAPVTAAGPLRVAVIDDTVGAGRGTAEALRQLREHGPTGYEIDLLGTGPGVDVRLPGGELSLPVLPGLSLGLPSLSAVAEALSARPYDLVHTIAPGPCGIASMLIAHALGLPVTGVIPLRAR